VFSFVKQTASISLSNYYEAGTASDINVTEVTVTDEAPVLLGPHILVGKTDNK
jgi:hypothetical protein